MRTRAEFVTDLRNRNWTLYLGGPSRFRTQSSMIPLVNAVAAFEALNSGDNLLAVIRAIGNLPAASKTKYAQALRRLYESFPRVIYLTVHPFALHTANVPGIGVIRSTAVPSHQTDAVLALEALNGFQAGQILLQDLVAEVVAGHRVGIHDAANTASGGNECAIVLGAPDDYQTRLAAALIGDRAAVGGRIGEAMTQSNRPPAAPGSYDWLENLIDNTPIYRLLGVPSATPSSVTYHPGWISAGLLSSWVSGATNFPAGLPADRVDDATVILGTVLNEWSPNGPGGHTRVSWNASNLTSAGTARPPFIGLGHELIHALHNMRGAQPGVEQGLTTVLYEYLCVGLGPYANAPNTENALRNGAGVALRPYYGP